jgi:MerR family mercuric resistance operon transcriptional regulator
MESGMARRTRRIGDVAKAAGVGVETVRFYEREGLIEQPAKPQRGWRAYDKAQLRQLGYVRLARELGLTLGDVKRVQKVARGPRKGFCSEVRDTLGERLTDIESQIAELERKRAALSDWLGQCRVRTGDCPLYERLHVFQPAKRKSNRET